MIAESLLVVGVVGVLLVPIDPEKLPEYLEAHKDEHQDCGIDVHTPSRGARGLSY